MKLTLISISISADAEVGSQLKTQCLVMSTQITALTAEAEALQAPIDHKLL
jgi:hypothetical protein